MRRVLALGASLCLLSAAHDAEAATFTPDMWIYEVTFTANSVAPAYFHAFSDAVPDSELDTLPDHCGTPYSNGDGTSWVDCGDAPGVDLLATMDAPLKAEYLTRVQTIGFNASTVVCAGPVIVGCPVDGRSTEPFAYSYEGSYWDVVLDATLGRLSFCGNMYVFSEGCYALSPETATAWAGVTALSTLTGSWDAVTGGRWRASGDPYFQYSGIGRLLSSPEPVLAAFTLSDWPQDANAIPVVVTPLPAPVLMLGSGLAAMAGLALRDRRRRRLIA